MAIHESARFSNVVRSICAYVQTSLEGVAGAPTKFPAAQIHWPNRPFDTSAVPYFLRVHVMDDEGRFFSRVAGSNPGSLKRPRLFLEAFFKRSHLGAQGVDNSYLLEDTLDVVKSYFMSSASIPVQNYQAGGATSLGKLWVRGRQPTTPKDTEWVSGGYMISLEWIEQDAAA